MSAVLVIMIRTTKHVCRFQPKNLPSVFGINFDHRTIDKIASIDRDVNHIAAETFEVTVLIKKN
jgi:hypothetical protein